MIKIINHNLKGKVSEISRRSWNENRLSMTDWEEYGIQFEPIMIKGLSEEQKENEFVHEEEEKTEVVGERIIKRRNRKPKTN